MTYIEFFDKTASENIVGCLMLVPERVILIGNKTKLMQKHIPAYERVFSDRGHHVEFIQKSVPKNNLNDAVRILSEIVEEYDDCIFDITGGDELLNVALGIVFDKYPEKNIQIHRFNLNNNAVYDCDMDGNSIEKRVPVLSIEENIRIYGGDIVYGEIDDDNTYLWDLNTGFVKDIDRIWNICKDDVRYWNTQIGILETAEKVGKLSEDGLTVTAKISAIETELAKNKAKYKTSGKIINALIKNRLLTRFDDSDGETLTVSFKNAQVKKCLTKAGQALEMKVYLALKNITDGEGNLVYDDSLNGVVIDWDGEFHDEETENIYDTENEIDVLLMHDMVPVFVSCKNGKVTSDELYKLNTVAERFGGTYSRKVLVATSIDDMGEAGLYLRQRAKDMGIKLVEKIQFMDEPVFEKIMRNLWKSE